MAPGATNKLSSLSTDPAVYVKPSTGMKAQVCFFWNTIKLSIIHNDVPHNHTGKNVTALFHVQTLTLVVLR